VGIAIAVNSEKWDAIEAPTDSKLVDAWYAQLAGQVAREDGLVGQRLTWLMQFEGLLFTAFGFVAKADAEFKYMVHCLWLVLPIAGMTTAYTTFRGVNAAQMVLEELKNAYANLSEADLRRLVRPFGGVRTRQAGLHTGRALPVAIGFTWLIIWLFECVYLLTHLPHRCS
jgi:hypothetical protein